MARRNLVLLALALAPAAPLTTQDKLPRWRIDPYTRNDPEAMARLGYVSYGPFEFGQRGTAVVTTDVIDKHLAYEQILWVETPHFRLGSTLDPWSVPFEPEVKAKIRAELEKLEARGLPRVKPRARTLDPWLRLHLFAQRLEEHYALMQKWLGVTDADFSDEARAKNYETYRGEGPYLGQKGKYLFLVFEKKTSFDDYLRSFTGRETTSGQQWNFKEVDGLAYVCAADNPNEDGRLKDDVAMHGHLVHAATHGLVNGYLHYNYDLPVWIREGLAHYFERLISPQYNSYTRSEGSTAIDTKRWRFDFEARRMLGTDKYQPFSVVYQWRDFGEMDFEDHVMVWSRWDYLLSLGQEKFATFMRTVKGRVDATTGVSQDQLVEATRKALQEAYQLSPLSLDERWQEFVKANYPTR